MEYLIADLLKTTQTALDEIAKIPQKKQQKQLTKNVTAVIKFFRERITATNNPEKIERLARAARTVITTTIKTGVYNPDIFIRLCNDDQYDTYARYCQLRNDSNPDTADFLKSIDLSWMSAERIYYIIDRYEAGKPMPKEMFSVEYDDYQAKAIWRVIRDYRTCISHDYDPMKLLNPQATPSAIEKIISASANILCQDHNPDIWLCFAKQDNFAKYKKGSVISFIADMNVHYPVNCGWRALIAHDMPDTTIAEIAENMRRLPGDDNKQAREDTARTIVDKWTGFTELLQSYYENIAHIYGCHAIYKTWQKDLRDNFVTGNELAMLLITRPGR